MEDFDNKDVEKKDKNLVFGQQVKAGKRVYFIDSCSKHSASSSSL